MVSLKGIPLPSIALVLASDRVPLPTRPSAIKFDFDPLQTIHPTNPAHERISNLNNTHIHQRDPVTLSVVDEDSVSDAPNDSVTDVQGDDASDAQTVFNSKRQTISQSRETMKFDFMALAKAIRKLLRNRTNNCPSSLGRGISKVDVPE